MDVIEKSKAGREDELDRERPEIFCELD